MVVTCNEWINPLELECLLVNTLSGSVEVFTFIMVMFIAGVGTTFRMMNMTILILLGLFALIMGNFISGTYYLAVLIVGLLLAFSIGKAVKR